eukprot:9053291-Pyramimonas_sp.AAC.2
MAVKRPRLAASKDPGQQPGPRSADLFPKFLPHAACEEREPCKDAPSDDAANVVRGSADEVHFFESFNGNCRSTLLERLKTSDSLIVRAQEIGTAVDDILDLRRSARHWDAESYAAHRLRDRGDGGELVKGHLVPVKCDIPGWLELAVYSARMHAAVGLDAAN